MNRPSPSNFWDRGGFKLSDYNDYLEEYCDELEEEIKNANSFIHAREVETTSMLEVYERALDKACSQIWMYEYAIFNVNMKTKEEWKECLMNDE